jgi:hypothetical protein
VSDVMARLDELAQARLPQQVHPSTRAALERRGYVTRTSTGAVVLTDEGKKMADRRERSARWATIEARLTKRHRRLIDRAKAWMDAHDRFGADGDRWRRRSAAHDVLIALVLDVDPAVGVSGLDTPAGQRLYRDCAATLEILADFDAAVAEARRREAGVTVDYEVDPEPRRRTREGARERARRDGGVVDLAIYREKTGREPDAAGRSVA